MGNKKSSGRSSSKLAAFNRTQEIYKLLEKGIIESEALLSTAADRPTDDAHVLELLESASAPNAQTYKASVSKRPGKHAKKAARQKKPGSAKPKHAKKSKRR